MSLISKQRMQNIRVFLFLLLPLSFREKLIEKMRSPQRWTNTFVLHKEHRYFDLLSGYSSPVCFIYIYGTSDEGFFYFRADKDRRIYGSSRFCCFKYVAGLKPIRMVKTCL